MSLTVALGFLHYVDIVVYLGSNPHTLTVCCIVTKSTKCALFLLLKVDPNKCNVYFCLSIATSSMFKEIADLW